MEEEKKKTNSKTNTKKSTSSTKRKTTKKVVKEVKTEAKKTDKELKAELEKEEAILKEELEVEEPKKEVKKVEETEVTEEPKEKGSGIFSVGEVIIVMILALVLGLVLGGFIVSTRMLVKESASGKRSKNVGDINEVYDIITREYYGKEIDKSKIADNGVYGMLNGLEDSYTEYVTAKETNVYDEYIDGEFVGIGVEIYQEELNNPVILKVFPGGPCDKAGIKENDVLLRVNGEEIQGREMTDITTKIKVNRPGTKLNVTVLRGEEELSFDLTREKVVTPTISVEYDESIAIVKIGSFTKHTAEEFKEVYKEIKEKGSKSIILDLRNNTGGVVETAKEVAEMFLDKNSVIYKVESNDGKKDIKSGTKKEITLDTVIIVNETTALGSEILASALRDNLGFKVIGQKTFGYGMLRKQFVLSDESYILVPYARWLTKEGVYHDGQGVEPDEVVEDTRVIERAKELLNNKI